MRAPVLIARLNVLVRLAISFKSQIGRDLLNALRTVSMGGQFVSSRPDE